MAANWYPIPVGNRLVYTRDTTPPSTSRYVSSFSWSFRSNTVQSFSTGVDKYHHIQRLDLKRPDGSLLHPMFLAYRPPKMLPTTTLNPTPTGSKGKRDLSSKSGFHLISREELINPKRWWWLGVLMTSLGGAAVFYS
jgi:hypothetical protein